MARSPKRSVIVFGVLVFIWMIVFRVFWPPGPDVICTRQLDGAFEQWMSENQSSNVFPNVAGDGAASLSTLLPFLKQANLKDHSYVPGLNREDPAALIFYYVKKPTSRRWHGERASIFRTNGWIVAGPGFNSARSSNTFEAHEWIGVAEFTNRLFATLSFLEANNRPNWQQVVAEQRRFLETVK